MEVMCYFTVLLPLEFDSSIFSFVISAKYNLLKVPVTGFCFVYFFKMCIIYCKQYRIRKKFFRNLP